MQVRRTLTHLGEVLIHLGENLQKHLAWIRELR